MHLSIKRAIIEITKAMKGIKMTYKIYNSSEKLVFEGNEQQFNEMKKNHLINDSDRIVIIK